MTYIPSLILLELHFRTIVPINNLPFYHGPHWSALFRNILKGYLPDTSMSKAGIWIHPIETGILSYEKDEPIYIGMTFPSCHASAVAKMLEEFNSLKIAEGHFQPGRTIILENVYCRITGSIWKPENNISLSEDLTRDEADTLTNLKEFTIHLHSPLRLPRPIGQKTEGHHYCDEEFFLDDEREGHLALNHLLNNLRIEGEPQFVCSALKVTGGMLKWLDVPYGNEIKKTIGGIVGKIKASGTLDHNAAKLLVTGQYTGAGKNPAFGLGFYIIPELDEARKIKLLSRGRTILQRSVSPRSLREALNKLPNSSPGPDMLSVNDIKKAGDVLFEKLSRDIKDGTYRQGGFKKYRQNKDDGSYREIHIQNATDRLVHRAATDALILPVDRLLSDSSYAYRKGLNRKGAAQALKKALNEGYSSGIKADIAAFFDSVNKDKLFAIMEGLFPFEPLVKRISEWLTSENESFSGLPQGSPLSPILSNLYLDRFDRFMAEEDLRLIKYADDFVVLFKQDRSKDDVLQKIERCLLSLGLRLKHEKTTEIKQGMPIAFLGYLITPQDISEQEKEKEAEKEWLPLFKDDWENGTPLYLTSICRGAYSSGQFLIIKSRDNIEDKLPWNQISRMIIVGRSVFSGGAVYRAVKENIPVTFIDVMGRTRGQLFPEFYEQPEIATLQANAVRDNEYCLSFAKEIISAKIHNSFVILKRNSITQRALKEMGAKVKTASDMETLRGYEGAASRFYFSAFSKLVIPFEFKGRVYHPPDGPVNVMLSLGYSILYNRLSAVLKDKGFNPRLGLFHKGRGMHAALASDLLEELRHLAERVVLSLIHRGEIKEMDFTTAKTKGKEVCRLGGDGFRKYIHRFEVAMAAKSAYHGSGKISYNACLDEMADRLKRSLKLNIPYKALRID